MTTAVEPVNRIAYMADPRKPRSLPQRIDIGVVILIAAFVLVGTSQIEPELNERTVDELAFVCAIVATGSLAFWRRWPVVVAGLVHLALGVYIARKYPPGPVLISGPLAMLALGYVESKRIAWLGVSGALVLMTIGSIVAVDDLAIHLLLFVCWVAAGVLAGQTLAAREERAAAELARAADAQERALAAERLRIAQDLHDSVAHAMATINVQSGVAAHLIESKPAQAGVALEAIRTASSDALEELGAILGVLRESDSAAPRSPSGGLNEISDLVERVLNDGLRVAFSQTGEPDAASSLVGATAYRVVQEALTNTLRHAGLNATATVGISIGDSGSLEVIVADDGGTRTSNAPPTDDRKSSGLGLIGMRERVEASGGALTVGPVPSGGFSVEACWPERVQA